MCVGVYACVQCMCVCVCAHSVHIKIHYECGHVDVYERIYVCMCDQCVGTHMP